MIPLLMAEREEELKSLLMKVKRGDRKAGLKLNIQKMNIMIPNPWQTYGEKSKQLNFILLGSKITADGDFSHEIKRCLLVEKLWQT